MPMLSGLMPLHFSDGTLFLCFHHWCLSLCIVIVCVFTWVFSTPLGFSWVNKKRKCLFCVLSATPNNLEAHVMDLTSTVKVQEFLSSPMSSHGVYHSYSVDQMVQNKVIEVVAVYQNQIKRYSVVFKSYISIIQSSVVTAKSTLHFRTNFTHSFIPEQFNV